MTIDYHSTFPDWAVALFVFGWVVLCVGTVIGVIMEWRDRSGRR